MRSNSQLVTQRTTEINTSTYRMSDLNMLHIPAPDDVYRISDKIYYYNQPQHETTLTSGTFSEKGD